MYQPKIDPTSFEQVLDVVDAHTVGEFCRIIYGGFTLPEGNSVMEKKQWMQKHADHLRKALMLEPRGHKEMFGAFLVPPVSKEADFGVIFIDTGGYLNMCGHCTIGTVTVILETGLKEMHEGENEVVLEAPAGIIRTKAIVKNKKVESVTLTNVPSFVYLDNQKINCQGKNIEFTISFGGSFFALVDVEKMGLPKIDPVNSNFYSEFGYALREQINKEIKVQHPLLDINTVDLVEFYSDSPDKSKSDKKNCVVFADHSIDRSPCGTGTSAKLATLYHHGELKIGEKFRYESIIGSVFIGEIKEEAKVGEYKGVIPMITGSAYLTGMGKYLIDSRDPLKYGFSL